MGGIILLLLVLAALYHEPGPATLGAVYTTGFILACVVYYQADKILDRLTEIECLVTPEDERSEDEKMHRWYKRAQKRGLIPKA